MHACSILALLLAVAAIGLTVALLRARSTSKRLRTEIGTLKDALAGYAQASFDASVSEPGTLTPQHDPVTGLALRPLLEELFQSTEALARRNHLEMTLLAIRLPHLTREVSHGEVDLALRLLASRLETSLRESDLVARTRDDEFSAILLDTPTTQHAQRVAEKVTEALSRPLQLRGRETTVSVQVGFGRYPQDGRNLDTLLRYAVTPRG